MGGAVVLFGTAFVFWRTGNRRAAAVLLALLVVGPAMFAMREDQSRKCDGRAWFCDFIPPDVVAQPAPAVADVPACPDADAIEGRVFTNPAADAEVFRLIDAGVCQAEAIERVAKGWKATYAPEYGTWWDRLTR